MTVIRVGEVKGLGTIFQSRNRLDRQIPEFQETGITAPYLATLDEVAQIRLSGLSTDYSRTSLIPLAVKDEPTILYRHSPFMQPAMARVAVQDHKNGKYPELPREFYEVVKQIAKEQEGLEPEDRQAIVLSQTGDYNISPETPEARFLIKKFTKEYFEKFKHTSIPIWNLSAEQLGRKSPNCVANYLWFGGPWNGSVVYLGNRYLYYDYRAFGVLRSTEGAELSQNSAYSLTQIRTAGERAVPQVLAESGLVRLTEILTNPITEKIISKLRDE